MPSVKVCLWNIQNYGQPSPKYDGGGFGHSNQLRNQFLAAFIIAQQLDVVMIQEVQPGAQAAMADLVTKLNALLPLAQQDWAYSFCGCAIKDDDVNVVTGPGDLIDRTGARSECYGVLWRRNRNTFHMVEGLHQIARATTAHVDSPLNISQLGRPTGTTDDALGNERFGATGGFTRDEVYPYELDEMDATYDLMDHWPPLNYPRTSVVDARRPFWSRSRRPAYVVLQLGDGHFTQVPVGAYHAPSNEQLASWGAYMTGLARELYAVDATDGNDRPDPTIDPVLVDYGFFGGDFNYSVDQADWPQDYAYFVDDRAINKDAGAYLTEVPAYDDAPEDRRSTVQIVTGIAHNQPINMPNNYDYFRLKIDLGFHRSVGNIVGERVDLLAVVQANAGGVYDAALTATAAFMDWVVAELANPFYPYPQRFNVPTGPQYEKTSKRNRRTYKTWVPKVCGSWGGTFIDWNVSRNMYHNHNITDARRAAEFIHIFITDHLPLVATINF